MVHLLTKSVSPADFMLCRLLIALKSLPNGWFARSRVERRRVPYLICLSGKLWGLIANKRDTTGLLNTWSQTHVAQGSVAEEQACLGPRAKEGKKEMSMPMQKKIPSQDSRKRKRPRVPLDQRQRAPVACASCRRLKEKCDGNIPCQRCARYKRECIAVSHAGTSRTELLRDDRTSSTARIQDLEFIARHFLGNIPLSAEHLRRLVLSLRETEPDNLPVSQEIEDLTLDQERFTVKSLSSSVAHYSGELSHWNFSQRVRGEVSRRLENVTPTGTQESSILEYWRANHLQSRSSAINKVTSSLPPKDVALFLINVYFKYAQTNTFFVDEAWIMKKMDVLYRTHDKLCGDDAAWICTTLGVLAVGTEFAHMEKVALQPIASKDSAGDNAAVAAGVSFYKLAAELIPDIITIASVESVQAFLLLAHYTLPLDTAGLAYTYLGLALKMAVQNGMHRRYIGDLNPEMVDLRSRLWWTAYRYADSSARAVRALSPSRASPAPLRHSLTFGPHFVGWRNA